MKMTKEQHKQLGAVVAKLYVYLRDEAKDYATCSAFIGLRTAGLRAVTLEQMGLSLLETQSWPEKMMPIVEGENLDWFHTISLEETLFHMELISGAIEELEKADENSPLIC